MGVVDGPDQVVDLLGRVVVGGDGVVDDGGLDAVGVFRPVLAAGVGGGPPLGGPGRAGHDGRLGRRPGRHLQAQHGWGRPGGGRRALVGAGGGVVGQEGDGEVVAHARQAHDLGLHRPIRDPDRTEGHHGGGRALGPGIGGGIGGGGRAGGRLVGGVGDVAPQRLPRPPPVGGGEAEGVGVPGRGGGQQGVAVGRQIELAAGAPDIGPGAGHGGREPERDLGDATGEMVDRGVRGAGGSERDQSGQGGQAPHQRDEEPQLREGGGPHELRNRIKRRVGTAPRGGPGVLLPHPHREGPAGSAGTAGSVSPRGACRDPRARRSGSCPGWRR